MTTITVEDVRAFAEKVERLCEFLTQGMEKDGSEDVVAIQKLQDEAADIQQITRNDNVSVAGLANYMKGVPES